ncbi:hypothetical protein [Maridesulfovibrio zosterae]|uniref:hypothetical protein n=1 Tax=Maridesulfovibrio zosterae TaxID=82171 RepID=UPI0003F56D9B|nr:hypothetical protein [Maridesulfovibrio zosterae]
MDVPPKNNPKWKDIVTGKKTCTLKFLAAKILLARLIRNVTADNSPGNVTAAVNELHAMFTSNAGKPAVEEDLKTLFS